MFQSAVLFLLAILCLAAFFSMIYVIRSRRFEDRVIGTNLICTIVINAIAVLTLLFNDGSAVDICLVFAILGFLAVVVLCRLLVIQQLEKSDDGKASDAEEGGKEA